MKPTTLFLSCEHAVDTIPADYQHLFKGHPSILSTHRAIDFGALEIATHLKKALACAYQSATISRLLIDCNRSLNHKDCFSEFTSSLSSEEKKQLIDKYYLPYRNRSENIIDDSINTGHQVLHLSIHSFTPVFNGMERNAGIGLLYDPKRHGEKEVARELQRLLSLETPAYRVRMNYPYSGSSDGFTTALRKKHPEVDYLGLEIEVNQSLAKNKNTRDPIASLLAHSIKELLLIL